MIPINRSSTQPVDLSLLVDMSDRVEKVVHSWNIGELL